MIAITVDNETARKNQFSMSPWFVYDQTYRKAVCTVDENTPVVILDAVTPLSTWASVVMVKILVPSRGTSGYIERTLVKKL